MIAPIIFFTELEPTAEHLAIHCVVRFSEIRSTSVAIVKCRHSVDQHSTCPLVLSGFGDDPRAVEPGGV